MIPKKIHYCWFGGNPLPESAKKCIASWRKFFPDCEIVEWNEENYDVNAMVYTAEAYKAKKYAFVSDVARFEILYREGGVYFDTDVEVIRPFDDILERGAFMGCERDGGNGDISVAPGLGIAAPAGLPLYRDIIEYYRTQKFLDEDGRPNTETVVVRVTGLLKAAGLEDVKGIQTVGGITVYPKEYFNPLDSNTGKIEKTENTRSVHLYSMTWLSGPQRLRSRLTRPFHRLFGEDCFSFLKK